MGWNAQSSEIPKQYINRTQQMINYHAIFHDNYISIEPYEEENKNISILYLHKYCCSMFYALVNDKSNIGIYSSDSEEYPDIYGIKNGRKLNYRAAQNFLEKDKENNEFYELKLKYYNACKLFFKLCKKYNLSVHSG